MQECGHGPGCRRIRSRATPPAPGLGPRPPGAGPSGGCREEGGPGQGLPAPGAVRWGPLTWLPRTYPGLEASHPGPGRGSHRSEDSDAPSSVSPRASGEPPIRQGFVSRRGCLGGTLPQLGLVCSAGLRCVLGSLPRRHPATYVLLSPRHGAKAEVHRGAHRSPGPGLAPHLNVNSWPRGAGVMGKTPGGRGASIQELGDTRTGLVSVLPGVRAPPADIPVAVPAGPKSQGGPSAHPQSPHPIVPRSSSQSRRGGLRLCGRPGPSTQETRRCRSRWPRGLMAFVGQVSRCSPDSQSPEPGLSLWPPPQPPSRPTL